MHIERLPLHNPGGLGIFAVMAQALAVPVSPNRGANYAGNEEGCDNLQRRPSVNEPSRGLLQRLDRWFWERQQRDLENYLAQSADMHDLEARIRMIERRGLRSYY